MAFQSVCFFRVRPFAWLIPPKLETCLSLTAISNFTAYGYFEPFNNMSMELNKINYLLDHANSRDALRKQVRTSSSPQSIHIDSQLWLCFLHIRTLSFFKSSKNWSVLWFRSPIDARRYFLCFLSFLIVLLIFIYLFVHFKIVHAQYYHLFTQNTHSYSLILLVLLFFIHSFTS